MGLRHLVVVIPGIGGSLLETKAGEPMWGKDRGSVVRVVTAPERLSLAEHLERLGVKPAADQPGHRRTQRERERATDTCPIRPTPGDILKPGLRNRRVIAFQMSNRWTVRCTRADRGPGA